MERLNGSFHYQAGRHYAYNAGLLIAGRESLLIDPGMTRSENDRIQKFMQINGITPGLILLTHFHWDHLLGLDRNNAPVAAHPALRQEFLRVEAGNRFAAQKWADESGESPANLSLPDDLRVLADGGYFPAGRFNLRCLYTPGHTADHISLFEESTGTLWAGDYLSDSDMPYISQSITAYRDTLAALAGLVPAAVIPGHGKPAGNRADVQQRFSQDIDYVDRLIDMVSCCVQAGFEMNEVVLKCAGFPLRNPGENEFVHRWNVESAFIELGGKAPAGITGWEREWQIDN